MKSTFNYFPRKNISIELNYINEFSRLCYLISNVVIVYICETDSFVELYNSIRNNKYIEEKYKRKIFTDDRVITLLERYRNL